MGKQNFAFVQALRGIAALWVVLYHAHAGGHVQALQTAMPSFLAHILFDAGHLGVAIFFTLSGFVIAHSLAGSTMTPGNWGRFMLRRSVRLDPAYWASMVLVVAFGALSARVKHEAFSLPDVGNVAAHIAYLQVILGLPGISPVYWTLTYEIQFYAFFAAAMMFPRFMWALLPLALASAIGVFDGAVPGLFVNLWANFFIGVLAKYASEDPRWLWPMAAIGVPLAWSGEFGLTNAITAVALWAAVRSGWAIRGFDWRWLQFLGAVSYSLYLIHNSITGAAGFAMRKVLGTSVLADAATLIVIIASSIGAAWLLWLTIERPSHALSKRILSERKPTEAAASPA
ncbi:acyltransferase family protein [Sphingopyxis terrae]|uniref:acyltransferase family protein n=1 Tax=Sphingopyxis terrae TaxID=33052 RepID=UPI001C2CB08A|nr:acyltransferase [Sphingopyxis terrae]QXF12714.1 acyltransferase [Sphingopyxis terrae subsp. terrae]